MGRARSRALPGVPSRAAVRLTPAFMVIVALALMVGSSSAQVPGPNVNMISVDKYLQKQNEIDLTISPLNPCHIVGAANDYRTVNNKGLNSDGEIGDSWIGVYVSTDCGSTWLNYIMNGYGVGYTTAADPVARFGPGGTLYVSHIQFNRGTNVGKVAVARYLDFNNFEGVLPASPAEDQSPLNASPVGFLGITDVAKGTSGKFLDKSSMAVGPGTGPACTINGRTLPAQNVYVAWTEFLSNSDIVLRTKVYLARSTDCGQTFPAPATKLSEGYPVNQGTIIAIHPTNPNIIYVAWRQVASDKNGDAVLYVKSTDGGQTFTKAQPVGYLGDGQAIVDGKAYKPFDQPTTSTTFRTLGYPAMVLDDSGRVYIAVAARVGLPKDGTTPAEPPQTRSPVSLDEARIVMTALEPGALSWAVPKILDPVDNGHQFMPAMAYAGGRVNLTWYDLRYDESATFKAFVDENDVRSVNTRHTLDVRGAQFAADANWANGINVYGISDIGDLKKKVSLYYAQNATSPGTQLNFNRANLKLYGGGTKPFLGDYIGTAGVQWVMGNDSKWLPNTANLSANTVLRTFQTAWTDNRDAIVGEAGDYAPGALDYTAPGACTAADSYKKMLSRNANIYTSRITPGLYLSALGNTKPTDQIPRSYAVQVENGTENPMTVKLLLTAPTGVAASFSKDVLTLDKTIIVPGLSSLAENIWVPKTPTIPYPRIDVTALQLPSCPNDQCQTAAIVLNATPVPALVQPTSNTQDISKNDTHTPRVENPRVENQTATNSGVKNPRVENPRVENPNETPRVENPRVENPRVENTTVATPRVENPRVENPRVENQGLENASFSDVTTSVTNDGNTTSAYDVNVGTSAPTGRYVFQLVGWRSYGVPTLDTDSCKVVFFDDQQVLFNLPLEPGDLGPNGLPTAKKPSVVIRPGETINWTLRAIDRGSIADTFVPFCTNDGPNACGQVLTTVVAAQAPNVVTTAGGQVVIEDPPVVVSGPPSIIPPTLPLPSAVVLTPYPSQTFNAVGFVDPVFTSPDLPSGLQMSSGGVLSGTPTVVGTHSFSVTVTDSLQRTSTRSFTIGIAPQPGDIVVADGVFGQQQGQVVWLSKRTAYTGVLASVSADLVDIRAAHDDTFLAVQRNPDRIIRVTQTGEVSTVIDFVVGDLGWESVPTSPVAVIEDNAGSIFVGDNGSDRVYRFQRCDVSVCASGWQESSFVLPQTHPSLYDLHIGKDRQGTLFVGYDFWQDPTTQQWGTRVLRVTPEPLGYTELVRPETGIDTPSRLGGLAVDGVGNFVLVDFGDPADPNRPPRVLGIDPGATASWVIAQNANWRANLNHLVIDSTDGTYYMAVNGISGTSPSIVMWPNGNPRHSGPPLTQPSSLTLVPGEPLPQCDLNVTVAPANGQPKFVGSPFSWTVTMNTTSPVAAVGVVMTITLREGAPYTGQVYPGRLDYDGATRTVTVRLDRLLGNTGFGIEVTPSTTGTKTITVSVTELNPDSNLSNNNASSTVQVTVLGASIPLTESAGGSLSTRSGG